MAEDYLYRVSITRKKTALNPKYRYYMPDNNEPRFFILDDTETIYSKPYKAKGTAKGERTRLSGYSPETLVSAYIECAELTWQQLTEEEL